MVTCLFAGARSVSVPTAHLDGWARRVRRPAAHLPVRRGFTLIELLLVLAILAALAAMVVPKFTRRSEQAKDTAARVDIANLEIALDAFEVDCGRFPTAQEGLGALLNQPADTTNWMGPYIKRGLPKDPWGNPYVYRYPGQHNTQGYDLYSFGPDGQEGGDDDVDNWSEQ
jgi:general secretion pathway protein G